MHHICVYRIDGRTGALTIAAVCGAIGCAAALAPELWLRMFSADPAVARMGALYLRIVRARMVEVLDEPFVRTARAKGGSELHVIRAHALPNAIAPVVTMLAMEAGLAIGIAMYIASAMKP